MSQSQQTSSIFTRPTPVQALPNPTATAAGSLARRVITGLGEEGEARIIYDDTAGHIRNLPNGARLQDSWWTDTVPADCSPRTNTDPTGNRTFSVTNEGAVSSFLWMPPGGSSPMHGTKSIDYVLILEGEIELELDGGDRTVLKSGDLIVQRETQHAWHNRSKTQWAKVFAVLIATKNAIGTEQSKPNLSPITIPSNPSGAPQQRLPSKSPISATSSQSPVGGTSPGPLTRRVVTGLGDEGKAKILYNDTAGHTVILPNGARLQDSWWTDTVPADCSPQTNLDPTGKKTFRIANEGSVATFLWVPPGESFPMHSTKSIDYDLVMEGEIELELDSGDRTILKAGDLIVQRETQHAWYNRSKTQWAKVFSIIIASNNAVTAEGT